MDNNQDSEKTKSMRKGVFPPYRFFAEIITEKKIRPAHIARDLGLSPVLFSEWKSYKSAPKIDKLQKIAEYLDVSVETLMWGNNKKIELSPKEEQLLELFKTLSDEQIDLLLSLSGEQIDSLLQMIKQFGNKK